MKKIGITGGPATGKTTLLSVVRDLGFPVFSADECVRRLLCESQAVIRELKRLAPEAFEDRSEPDRAYLLRRLVRDAEFRRRLEGLLHPEVKKELEEFFRRHEAERFVFAEVPLLFEVGWEGLFDEVWVVWCPEDVQLKRLKDRLGDEELARALISIQMPLSEKLKKATRTFSSLLPPETLKTKVCETLR